MSHTPSPPDKTFIGRRSRLAGVIYFILGALNFLHCLLYFQWIFSPTARTDFIIILIFIGLNIYFLTREFIYKCFHWCGYHALPELVEFGSGRYSFHLPVFERHTENYKIYYSKRSKKHQFLFFVSYILYVNLILGVLLLFSCVYWSIFIESSSEFQDWHAFLFIFSLIILYISIESLFKKYKHWFKNYFKLDDKIVERGFPIYTLQEK